MKGTKYTKKEFAAYSFTLRTRSVVAPLRFNPTGSER